MAKDGNIADDGKESRALFVGALTREERVRLKREFRRDEIKYSWGVLNLIAMSFIVGRWPQHMWIYHGILAMTLLPWRYVSFSKLGWQWYMLDFCYFTTYYTQICCWISAWCLYTGRSLFKYRALLLKAGFSYSISTLGLSTIAFGERLTFQDREAITNVYIHLGPSILMWCIRWGAGLGPSATERAWPGMFVTCPEDVSSAEMDACVGKLWCSACTVSLLDITIKPMFMHLAFWGLPYLVLVFGPLYHRLLAREKKQNERGSFSCLYFQLTKGKNAVGRYSRSFPKRILPAVFILHHAATGVVFGWISYLSWNSFAFHTAFVLVLITSCVFNGSKYNFQKFSMDYAQSKLVEKASVISNAPSGDGENEKQSGVNGRSGEKGTLRRRAAGR